MLAMSEVNCIKLLRNQKSKSINSIANTLGINWRTAKKYADHDDIPQETYVKKRGMMYEEKWGDIVSDWLIEDQKLHRKNRRTNKTIYEQLQELGFTGSYRTVCLFIQDWKEGKIKEESTKDRGYERLQHPPGEAQVDFGTMEAVKDGKYIDIHGLSLSLPYSNAAFCVPLPGENQECFLYGLKTIFHQMGGVPNSIRIDNLKAAVIRPRRRNEEVQFTDEFLRFANHYGFEIQDCNPYSGHEKGHVENKVGYIRYNFATPSPVMESFEQLTKELNARLVEDRQRLHYEKQIRIEELFQEEQKYLYNLPDNDYPIFKEKWVRANKYGEVTIDQVKMHIPKSYNFGQLRLVLYWNSFKVVSPNGELLHHDYRPYMQSKRNIPWQPILSSWLDKPRVVTYSRYKPYLPTRIYEYIRIENLELRKERIQWLIRCLTQYDMNQIDERFYELVEEQSFTTENHPYEVNWSMYDQLQQINKRGELT
ncbi:IS21 family transposase [Allobacillus sp. GCM10007491]|uniref:IS21 family transposase n=1 Tax=Allobacillus saliphilus TaxID=2912308 RepID=A0A941CW06_9BACI|nr:IS21 family transposase [Allobacillus saliphilus]MBR7555028.1 IS21 family transposase [Allobacillus saliphilus]